MKALQLKNYGSFKESLSLVDVNKPSYQANDVLIEVKAASVNPIDKSIILGNLQALLPLSFPTGIAYDVCGIVSDKGSAVTDFEIGDHVYARVPQEQMGTLAEYVAVNTDAVSKKPGNISYEEAASIPLAGLTAFQALEYVKINENDKVLIHAGSGGVGSFAIQYAKAKGAYVYTTTSTRNVKWVKALGADKVIDYKTEDYKAVVEAADIVFDTLGKNYTAEAFDVIKKGGKVISIAGPLDVASAKMFGMTDYKLPEELNALCQEREATYTYLFMHPNGTHLKKIKTLIEDEKIKPIIDKIYKLEDSAQAFIHLASGRARGKIVIKIK